MLAIEGRYKAMIQGAKNKDWNVAAGTLENFMSQEKDPLEISSDWLLQQPSILAAVEKNKGRFYDSLMGIANSMKPGESRSFSDYWDVLVEAEVFTEFYYASGKSTLTSTGNFNLNAAGNGLITIRGSIQHSWYDRYDWHDGLSVTVPIFGTISDSDGNKMIEAGRAKEFDMRSTWLENVEW
ncbi:hypothetical protein BTJ40_10780 [Microbulbifer sp. A4B17]|uniref:hypothetical protein n=1 Tax=Microbulbifer sp. A4B17 TaxID=359370 RepID=UPI000D52CFAB|nr:hypothetical protein [Microbulbifer sp. A4B17]AWF81264.1 hypothetical protein BTJ40_10780 [Microbulbifer sp. A4B17]